MCSSLSCVGDSFQSGDGLSTSNFDGRRPVDNPGLAEILTFVQDDLSGNGTAGPVAPGSGTTDVAELLHFERHVVDADVSLTAQLPLQGRMRGIYLMTGLTRWNPGRSRTGKEPASPCAMSIVSASLCSLRPRTASSPRLNRRTG